MSTHGFYYERKRLHMCVWCGKQDARTLIGKIYCFDCLEKKNAQEKKWFSDPEHIEALRANQRERYRSLKEQGICVCCKKRKAEPGRVSCKYCLAKNRRRMKHKSRDATRRNKREEIAKGNCAVCFAPAVPGYKLCEKHLETIRKASKIAGEKRSERARKRRNGRKEENNPNSGAD